MNDRTPTSPAPLPAQPDRAAQAQRRPGQRWPALWGPRLWALMALALLLTAYRAWFVGHSGISLFFDEAQYWDWSRELQWGYYSKPPMIAALIHVGTSLWGDSILGVKLLPMLLYPLTALAMVVLARALWPTSSGVRTGVVAGALFITLPMVGTMGLFASTDAPLLLFWTLAAWALWRAQVTDRPRHWAALGVACGLGLMSKYTMAAFAITAIWALWAVHGPRRGLLRAGPWLAVAIALLLLAPNLWWNAHNGFPTLQHTAELTTASGGAGGLNESLEFIAGQALMLGPLAVIAAAWLWWRARQSVLPPPPVSGSTWAASTQLSQFITRSPVPTGPQGRPIARSSAYYLAAESSYRYLWALSLPLLVIAAIQAFHAGANINWAAPAFVGLSLLVASRLSAPLVPLAAPRPNGWLVAVLASNLLLTGLALHARDLLPQPQPASRDALVRMRGWQEAFAQVEPSLRDPVVLGLPVLTDQRQLVAQAAYNWRQHRVRTLYWNPRGLRNNHYQLQHSLPNKIGQDVLLVTATPHPTDILQRFAIVRRMASAKVEVAQGRFVEVHSFFLRGFLGYDQKTYMEQSGQHDMGIETP